MEQITIDSKDYKLLVQKIDRIYNYVVQRTQKQAAPHNPSQVWIGNAEATKLLEISFRTLQRLRSNGEITYSIRGGKARYRLSEVQRLIAGRVIHRKQEQEAEKENNPE